MRDCCELPRLGAHRPDYRSWHGYNRRQRRVAVYVGLLPLRHDLGGDHEGGTLTFSVERKFAGMDDGITVEYKLTVYGDKLKSKETSRFGFFHMKSLSDRHGKQNPRLFYSASARGGMRLKRT